MRPGQTAPRTITQGLRQRAWWVMRRHVVFTLPELLATLATGTERDATSNLSKYLRALALAGFVSIEGRAQPASLTSNGSLRYRLVIDNGRKAPVWRQRSREVFDPNDGKVYSLEADHA